MPINVNKQIQEAMELGGFDVLATKGTPHEQEDNPLIPHKVRIANQMLKDKGFAACRIDVDKALPAEIRRAETLLANIAGRPERLEAAIRAQPRMGATISNFHEECRSL